jgi:hypothetical protein
MNEIAFLKTFEVIYLSLKNGGEIYSVHSRWFILKNGEEESVDRLAMQNLMENGYIQQNGKTLNSIGPGRGANSDFGSTATQWELTESGEAYLTHVNQ